MTRTASPPAAAAMLALALVVAGCASRSADVPAVPEDPAQFARWSCGRIDDESERVQRRAAELAYAVDQRAGNNIVALGVGLAVFWPALVALRPDGLEAEELARLKGRHEALVLAASAKRCPPAARTLPPERAAALPVAPGERLVYEERTDARRPGTESALVVTELRRGEVEYRAVPGQGTLVHDAAGNVVSAPDGELAWPRLLRSEMALGQVSAGEILVTGDPLTRARVRGQVVALGPQTIAGRRFEVMVVELFGDAQRGDSFTRLDGAMVVDRTSGVLLRLDLRSAQPPFALQRRLLRVDARP